MTQAKTNLGTIQIQIINQRKYQLASSQKTAEQCQQMLDGQKKPLLDLEFVTMGGDG